MWLNFLPIEVFCQSPAPVFIGTAVSIARYCKSRHVMSGRILRTSAKIPAAKGAAAEVPPCAEEQTLVPISVVCCHILVRMNRVGLSTYNRISSSTTICDNHIGRAALRVVWMVSHTVHRPNSNTIDTVRVTI